MFKYYLKSPSDIYTIDKKHYLKSPNDVYTIDQINPMNLRPRIRERIPHNHKSEINNLPDLEGRRLKYNKEHFEIFSRRGEHGNTPYQTKKPVTFPLHNNFLEQLHKEDNRYSDSKMKDDVKPRTLSLGAQYIPQENPPHTKQRSMTHRKIKPDGSFYHPH